MKKPNFFIIGGPKCGTTSIYQYLRKHPNIFMPEIKGPHYYATDLGDYRPIKSYRDYLKLFDRVNNNHKAVGEASALYLFSRDAAKSLHNSYLDAKIIILIRNPIEVARSWHNEVIWGFKEKIKNFNEAIRISHHENYKKQFANEPAPQIFNYSQIAMFGEQIEQYYKYFSKSQILIINFDDFLSNTRKVHDSILRFLGVEKDKIVTYKVYNSYKIYRSVLIQKFITHPPRLLVRFLNQFKRIFGISRLNIFKFILEVNKKNIKKLDIDEQVKTILKENYKDDIKKLSRIISKDLGHWLEF